MPVAEGEPEQAAPEVKETAPEAEEKPKEEAAEEQSLTEDGLHGINKKDITKKCHEMGITYSPNDTKAQLIKKILRKT